MFIFKLNWIQYGAKEEFVLLLVYDKCAIMQIGRVK